MPIAKTTEEISQTKYCQEEAEMRTYLMQEGVDTVKATFQCEPFHPSRTEKPITYAIHSKD